MIATERLELRPLDRDTAQAMVDGERGDRAWHEEFPVPDDQDAARSFLRDPHDVFGSFVIVEQATGLAIGTIGFFGPPDDDGIAMLGYGLVPSARGRGYATEALRGLMGYAFAQGSVRLLVADTLRDNVASQRVLEKAGFARTHSTDEAHWYATGAPPASDGEAEVLGGQGARQ
ncbi:GNAT family protein [Rugosimonospora acidiphila]|uniref:GNAT family protein n=1 Tax=Rugosimonospora acidiphila TaxID=556531 RepID=A0ABP9RRD5_9ACTN